MNAASAPIESVSVSAYRIPTDQPESDGTLAWEATTLVLVEITAAGRRGLGYTYGDTAVARLIEGKLAPLVEGANAPEPAGARVRMAQAIRNLGAPGIAQMAIAAVDTALWDLKARLLECPLAVLVGRVHETVPVYGSGGFTSYSIDQLQAQLADWVAAGIARVKIKVGRDPADDPARVTAARDAIGPDADLFVDANGAYDRKQALAMAEAFARVGVTWFEEPVSSRDRAGLRLLRDRAPPGVEISAGEYGYIAADFRDLLTAGAVDVLQADASRCGGLSGFLDVAALCRAFEIPLSTHTCPMLHLPAACAARPLRHMEWFHDHVRIERMLFDGFIEPGDGRLRPDLSQPGLGLEFRHADARRYAL